MFWIIYSENVDISAWVRKILLLILTLAGKVNN